MSATNPRGAVIAAIVGAAAAEERRAIAERIVDVGLLAAQADSCPMGGEHDPGDSDRPCPRCGASPR